MKVNVYVIVSYVDEQAKLEGDLGMALLNLDAPKMIRMDLVRSFSREKLVNAFKDVIEKNYEDTSAFAADYDSFCVCFDRDAEDGDELIFDYNPPIGLTISVNGESKRVIENFEFVKALWTVWFGEKPANNGMKEKLLAELGS